MRPRAAVSVPPAMCRSLITWRRVSRETEGGLGAAAVLRTLVLRVGRGSEPAGPSLLSEFHVKRQALRGGADAEFPLWLAHLTRPAIRDPRSGENLGYRDRSGETWAPAGGMFHVKREALAGGPAETCSRVVVRRFSGRPRGYGQVQCLTNPSSAGLCVSGGGRRAPLGISTRSWRHSGHMEPASPRVGVDQRSPPCDGDLLARWGSGRRCLLTFPHPLCRSACDMPQVPRWSEGFT